MNIDEQTAKALLNKATDKLNEIIISDNINNWLPVLIAVFQEKKLI